jgi:alpha-L-fucosidase
MGEIMKTTRIACILGALFGLLLAVSSAAAQCAGCCGGQCCPSERDARMQWWREARFGMFIHWGLYAVPAGQWQGKAAPGLGEWIMDAANIPVAEYEKFAGQFNPTKYDAARWVAAAKAAGVKYIVITSKHHDGFSLFGTKGSKYNAVDGSPYGKDLLKPLAEECRKQGIRFCTYYSIMDWHHPAQDRGSAQHYNPTKIRPGRKAEYVAFMKQQLQELLDGPNPDVLWFDGEWPDWWTEADAADLYAYLRGLKPSLIINNRIGKGREGMEGLSRKDREYSGDFGTPEQQIPATGLSGVDWESCMTMNDTWGFRSDDHKWKPAEELIRNIIDTASKGGNYLLNVGPTAQGEIPGPSLERLRAIGRWMAVNGESIYGTQASPLKATPWGRATRKMLADGKTRLYFHVFQWPQDGKLVVPGLANKPCDAFLLDSGKKLKAEKHASGLSIGLPAAMPDKTATVVVVDVEGKLEIKG